MKIEKVNETDAEELLGIYSYYVKNTAVTFEYDVPTLDEFKQRIRTISSRFPYIKISEGNKILGYAYANTFRSRKAYDWCAETTVYLDKNERGKGLGTMLYKTLEESLRKMGICTMLACVTYAEIENKYLTHASPEFHLKEGFKVAGTFHHSGYKFDTWFDMVYYEKQIGEYSNHMNNVTFGKWKI